MKAILLLSTMLSSIFLVGCITAKPKGVFDNTAVPAAPDYSSDQCWAALPWRLDAADLTPQGLKDEQAEAEVDVFFLHPTTYTGERGDKYWNAPVDNADLNTRTNKSPIQYQASLFNGVGRVFAPYYRQAHLNAYFNRDTASAARALDLAYEDVRAAFVYYLEHHNQGRPIIIASHSQGTTHGSRLVREFFDGKPLQKQLVAAYLVGIPVFTNEYENIRPCRDSLDTGCLMSWRTWRRNHGPAWESNNPNVLVTNPLSWNADTTYVPASLNRGGVITPFTVVRPAVADAQIHQSVLWTKKPHFPGSVFYTSKNFHPGDFNFYYMNVRENAKLRVSVYLAKAVATPPSLSN